MCYRAEESGLTFDQITLCFELSLQLKRIRDAQMTELDQIFPLPVTGLKPALDSILRRLPVPNVLVFAKWKISL